MPANNLIDEAQFFSDLESGKMSEVEKPPINPAAIPSGAGSSSIPTLSGSLPASMQLPTDLVRTQTPGIPSSRIWPMPPSGSPQSNSGVTSATKKLTEQVTETTVNVAKIPVITTPTDGNGNQNIQVEPPPQRLPGPPPIVKRIVPIIHNPVRGRISIASLLGDNSGNITDDLIDGSTTNFMHSRMSGAVQGVITPTSKIANTAPVVGHPSPNIGTALQKLNSGGLLTDADQVAADGATFIRHSIQTGQALAVPDPNFVLGVQSWTTNNANLTLSQVSQSPFTNGKAMQLRDATGGATPFALLTQQFKVSPGDTVFWSAYFASDGVYDAALSLIEFDGSGNQVAVTDAGPTTSTAWIQKSATKVIGASTAYVVLRVNRRDAGTGTQVVWITDIQLTRAASLDNEVVDGLNFKRVLHVNADNTFHVSTALNNQASIIASPNASVSYTSNTNSITWSWSAFTIYYPDGSTESVAAGSQSFTGLAAATTFYFEFYVVKGSGVMTCVKSDNSTAPASLQFLVQTVGADGHAVEVTDITAATTSSNSGGGSGGGGTCFSGDTKVKTPQGFVRMDALPQRCRIVNLTGEHEAEVIVHRDATETMRIMPCGGLVTEAHLLRQSDGTWVPASSLFSENAPQESRTLYDIHVITENPEDMHYVLENGYIAHNKKRIGCFSGDTRIKTIAGVCRLDSLPNKFTVLNSEGEFAARLVKHENCREQMYELPDGALSTADHFIRKGGETGWQLAHELLPPSDKTPSALFNVLVEGSDYFVLSNGFDANDMEGNS